MHYRTVKYANSITLPVMIAGYVKNVMSAKRKGTRVSKEFITKAHYPDSRSLILERHTPSYGLCTECSSFSTYIPYPCPIVTEAINE